MTKRETALENLKKAHAATTKKKKQAQDIRNAFYNAFDPEEFEEWKKKNRTEYYRLLPKILPKDHNLTVRFEQFDPFDIDEFKKK